jgi:hypothetical protein
MPTVSEGFVDFLFMKVCYGNTELPTLSQFHVEISRLEWVSQRPTSRLMTRNSRFFPNCCYFNSDIGTFPSKDQLKKGLIIAANFGIHGRSTIVNHANKLSRILRLKKLNKN